MGSDSTKQPTVQNGTDPQPLPNPIFELVPEPTSDALAAMVANLDEACRQVDEACRQAQETSAQVKAEMISQAHFTEPLPDRPDVVQRRKAKPKARKRNATKRRSRGTSRRSTTNRVGRELSAASNR